MKYRNAKADAKLKEIKNEEKKHERKLAQEQKKKEYYIELGFENICPGCATLLENEKECNVWINGEYGDMEVYFRCGSCGFEYISLSGKSIDECIDFFCNYTREIIGNNKKWWQFWK